MKITTKTIHWKVLKKRSETWKSLIVELKTYGEIKSAIKAQQVKKREDKKRN